MIFWLGRVPVILSQRRISPILPPEILRFAQDDNSVCQKLLPNSRTRPVARHAASSLRRQPSDCGGEALRFAHHGRQRRAAVPGGPGKTLKQKYRKPGNVYLGVVSRAGRPGERGSNFARTSKAARRLNEQFRGRTVEKSYLAVVEGVVQPPQGSCVQQVARNERSKRMEIVGAGRSDAQEARLRYRRLAVAGGKSLLAVALRRGESTRFACSWPSAGIRFWAIANMVRSTVSRRHRPARAAAGIGASGETPAAGIGRSLAGGMEKTGFTRRRRRLAARPARHVLDAARMCH